MILTTNRVRDFDDAVQSRINVGIAYGNLDLDTRKAVWEKFLTKESIQSNRRLELQYYNRSFLCQCLNLSL